MNRIRKILKDKRFRWALERLQESHWAINTTTRCQHRCLYCFEGDRTDKRDLDRGTVRRVLRQAVERVPMVVFMGAEPTLNPHIVDHIRYGTELGLTIVVSTNALKFANKNFLAECIRAGLPGCEVSFPYPDEKAYSRITKANPRGFFRIVMALENIEEINQRRQSATPARAPFYANVNLVVSKFNHTRLREVLDLVNKSFTATPFIVTAKWVCTPMLHGPTRQYLEEIHVPLRELRKSFGELLASWDYDFPIVFRQFPLCVLDEHEDLAVNILYQQENQTLECNFWDQDQLVDMHPWLTYDSEFRSKCSDCSLEPICLDREILKIDTGNPLNLPVPSGRSYESILAEIGLESDAIDEIRQKAAALEASRPKNVARDFALALSAVVGADRRFADSAWTCNYLKDWHVLLSKDNAGLEVYVGAWRRGLGTCLPAGRLVVAVDREHDLDADEDAADALKMLASAVGNSPNLQKTSCVEENDRAAALLRKVWNRSEPYDGHSAFHRLIPVCTLQEQDGLALEAKYSFSSGKHRALIQFLPSGDKDEPDGIQTKFVEGRVPARSRDRQLPDYRKNLDSIGGKSGLEPELHAFMDRLVKHAAEKTAGRARSGFKVLDYFGYDVLILSTRDGKVLPCRIGPPHTASVPAFLCGDLALMPDPGLLKTTAGIRLLHSLALFSLKHAPSCDRISRRFYRLTGELLGDLLIPRAASGETLRSGELTEKRIRLAFETRDGAAFDLYVIDQLHAPRSSEREIPPISIVYRLHDENERTRRAAVRVMNKYLRRATQGLLNAVGQ